MNVKLSLLLSKAIVYSLISLLMLNYFKINRELLVNSNIYHIDDRQYILEQYSLDLNSESLLICCNAAERKM